MNLTKKHRTAFDVTVRVLLALIGGYFVSMYSAILIGNHLLSDKTNSIITGLMLSFIFYLVTVLFVFATKTTLRAFLVVFGFCLVLNTFNYYLQGPQ
ncbi:hypothetical protein NQT69_10760 [Pseudoalteromonas shioyasakiensis]|uniref:hypothetical protein n=1 Tax=Pseudoalteromonas shioyasakiensis TaxID=1190813 RepID=UPI002118F3A7|nr:hypothetical protein [Pseudoalteromonas shioyasakiensis]MCQ8878481.1 hypothetical protein [Pseudoalteromonas shioyasakiensis]